MKSKLTVLLALLCGAAVLAACGGDDKPTKAEYVSDAVEICKENDEKVKAIDEKFEAKFDEDTAPEASDIQDYANEVVPKLEDDIERYIDLDQPEGDEEEIDKINEALRDAVDTFKEAQDDEAVAAELLEGNDPFEEYNELAVEYDKKLEACVD